jgi:hypothetical protein
MILTRVVGLVVYIYGSGLCGANTTSVSPSPGTTQPRFSTVRLAVLGQNWQHVAVVIGK